MAAKVFLAHASQDRSIAEEITLALRGAGFEVFFDESDLPPGGDYHARIRDAVSQSVYLVFLISPDSVAGGRYTLSELKLAQEKWSHPADRVLPVMVRPTPMAEIPPYLKAVTILHPKGSASAEVASALRALVFRPSEGNEISGSAKRRSIPAATSKVELIGSKQWFLISPQIILFIDDKEVARMKLNDRLTLELEPGTHNIFGKLPLVTSSTATFYLKPGQIQAFSVSVNRIMGGLNIEPLVD
jgi:TIR domain-containing protein